MILSFIQAAEATAAEVVEAAPVSGWDAFMQQYGNWFMIILLIAIFYFFMIRPQQKRQKETKKFRDSLGKGSKVITAGGIHGTIKEIKDNIVMLEVAGGVTIRVELNMIYPSAEGASADALNAEKN